MTAAAQVGVGPPGLAAMSGRATMSYRSQNAEMMKAAISTATPRAMRASSNFGICRSPFSLDFSSPKSTAPPSQSGLELGIWGGGRAGPA